MINTLENKKVTRKASVFVLVGSRGGPMAQKSTNFNNGRTLINPDKTNSLLAAQEKLWKIVIAALSKFGSLELKRQKNILLRESSATTFDEE